MTAGVTIQNLSKRFCLHEQGGVTISLFDGFSMEVRPGEAVAITGPSGKGKSSLLKLIYGTYKASGGSIKVIHDGVSTDVVEADPRSVIELRKRTVGYVTQFLRVIPRVATLDIVAQPLIERGMEAKAAKDRAGELLDHLSIPARLWSLSPLTFSGGEQQRVNIARGFAASYPLLLIDEPTASLDAANRDRVLELIVDAHRQGSTLVCIFHDEAERRRVCGKNVQLS